MNAVPSAKIRNVALIGHGGAGKTTLAEALLVVGGVLSRPGRTEDGTTVCDFEPEEVKRQISVSLALAPFLFEDCKINVIDTPGYADFIAEVEAGLSVADLAVLVVSAVEGVEVQTEETWRLATELGIPRLVFVNKLDRERADFERTLDQMRERFGSGIAPLELPIGAEASFNGIADLLTDTAITYGAGKPTTGPIPEDMSALQQRVRGSFDRRDRRRRRRDDGALPRRRGALHQGPRSHARPWRRLRERLPRRLRVGPHRCRHRPPRLAHLRDRPEPARPPDFHRAGRQRHHGAPA